ncbi:hypothetical protein P691DRAFT_807540 [Macrolepiota fuliginosa MF-IS2]|uniref:DUF2470 domain-containing protein n=1 Tax=Macrolepiota fuliginosa MF-IS2 TaxID=1400762 RepID=A0A9P6BXR9_9AGAR|nr:hypothetical protein P691DRAFT_807540 [Macrolepiota fuliginosa MF-IS2]
MSKQSSTPDPVAEKSGFLRMYMSNHPDTLVAYAKWYGKVPEAITSAEMSAIDTKSMTLACVLKGGAKKEVYIPIEPPLKGYEDVKPRLLEMKALAQEGLGMIKAPPITTFYFPNGAIVTTFTVLLQIYCSFAPQNSGSPQYYVANFFQGLLGIRTVRSILYASVGIHVLECWYTYHLCRRHRTGFGVGALYVAATFVCGFPIWRNLRKKIQAARIESVMKVE